MRTGRSILLCTFGAILAMATVLRPAAVLAAPTTLVQERIPDVPTSKPGQAATIEAIRCGFDGYLSSDAWGPVRIYVSGNPTMNSGAFAGTVSLEFVQDASQRAAITTAFATTPGRITPIEIVAAIPRSTPSVTVVIRDQTGRRVHERVYWQAQFGEAAFPATILDNVHLAAVLVDNSGPELSVTRAIQSPQSIAEQGFKKSHPGKPSVAERLAACPVREEDLPSTSMGFDTIAMLVARSDGLANLPEAKATALTDWVRAGGCLVVVAGADSQAWMRRFWTEPPIEIQGPTQVDPEPDLLSARASSAMPSALMGRVVRLMRPSAETGWTIDWGTLRSVRRNGELHDGLLAQGPAGYGWIIVLGIEPTLLSASVEQLQKNWFSALRHALAETATRGEPEEQMYWRGRTSGRDQASRNAVREVLDSLAVIPALGDAAFIAVVVFLLLLAIAMGPVDAFVLKRFNLRAWSWASALLWIALASVLAAVVPPLIRSGESTSRRLRVVDILQAEGAESPKSVALTSIFANSETGVAFLDPGRDSLPPVGWFRGISTSYLDDRGRSQPLAIFETFQMETRPQEGTPERINSPSPRTPMDMGQWTLRSVMDTTDGRSLVAPRAEIVRTNGSWEVRIAGLTGTNVAGLLRIGTERFEFAGQTIASPDSPVTLRIATTPNSELRWSARTTGSAALFVPNAPSEPEPAPLAELPGARERIRVIEALLASGGWACLSLFETGNTPSLNVRAEDTGDRFVETESTLWRIMIPLEPDQQVSAGPRPAARMELPQKAPP
ncbi:MAG: hypothetical protein J0L78_00735 [Planctomycetes bacterium]|nr:hypothetical protein [Planctomycetota bacterium]